MTVNTVENTALAAISFKVRSRAFGSDNVAVLAFEELIFACSFDTSRNGFSTESRRCSANEIVYGNNIGAFLIRLFGIRRRNSNPNRVCERKLGNSRERNL